ncbi:4Fe-4S single cluster domain-containing protein [Oscillospiraceae bacterium MB08-C2-2]|nr:4Fe-4S single cluster domain-containing protein [Oscillospiraceae bacterium MB08-C2-2]
MESIRLYGVVQQSIVDGPGLRFTVFTQGCPHRCPGCHNPESHDPEGGYDCPIDRILEHIDKNPLLAGVTLSGGEPFAQPRECLLIARAVKERGLGLMAYTGYTYEQLLEMSKAQPEIGQLLELLDYLVDGPFLLEQRSLSLPFRGSGNQRILDMNRIREAGIVEHTEL